MINSHGGDAEYYKGLDSHLWAVYHGDFDKLAVTAHLVSPELDKGDVVIKRDMNLDNVKSIGELRLENMRVCTSIIVDVLQEIGGNSTISHRKQQDTYARYYSFMPAVLKSICVKKFNKFITYR